MFATSRFPQLGILAILLAGCASGAGTASPSATTPAAAVTPAPDAAPPIRIALAAPSTPPAQQAGEPTDFRAAVTAFAQQAAASRNLPQAWVDAAMADAQYNAQVVRLMTPTRGGKPVVRSWTTYRKRFVEPIRIRQGRAFMQEHQAALQAAEQRYGVPAHIIAAIIGVETLYGRQTGDFRVLDALTTLGLAYPDPKRPERAAMFRDQLADFLRWTYDTAQTPSAPLGSFAGAMGIPQFMPTSVLKYAVDGDQDGRIDLHHSPTDAIFSVANFLREHGWEPGLPVFVPVTLSAQAKTLADGGLIPQQSWGSLQAAGASAAASEAANAAWRAHPLGVVDLKDEARGVTEFRTATPNFFALTQYNRSYFYATSVSDLAQALLP